MRWKEMELAISGVKKGGIGYLRKRLIKGKLVVIKSPSLFKVLAEDIINNCW